MPCGTRVSGRNKESYLLLLLLQHRRNKLGPPGPFFALLQAPRTPLNAIRAAPDWVARAPFSGAGDDPVDLG